MGRYSRSRRGEWMAQRDRAAMDIEPLAGERQLTLDGAGLRRERLVDLDEIHVIHRQSGLCQSGPRRGHRTDSHHGRIDSCHAPRNQPSEWLQLAVARELLAD